MKLITLLYVALGSAIGGSLRYAIGLWVQHFFASAKHFHATITVNIIGCFFMGILFSISLKHGWSERTMGFLIVGLLGGFTTFSSFGLDILRLLNNGEIITAFGYMFLSVLVGVLAVFVGYLAFR